MSRGVFTEAIIITTGYNYYISLYYTTVILKVMFIFPDLQGLGMSSHDDRNLFKKEIKNLKPYADKHKKLLDKQRKEEKKNAKKKKK